jgi:hypothetical protein
MVKWQLTWISTTGGPHLVVPEKHAADWEGAAEPSHGRVVQAKFQRNTSGQATDYHRACDVTGWQGLISIGRGQGIVLSGDVGAVAYYTWQERHFILRWLSAPSEAAILARFREIVAGLEVVEEVSLSHPGGNLFLMDAGDIPQSWLGEHAAFALPDGRYRVTAAYYAEDEISLVAHEWHLR